MGSVLSSETIYAVAYLTDLGRKYLFDPINSNRFIPNGNNGTIDSFKIVYFSMSDPDYNYNVTSGYPLQTGDVANVSGKNSDCIKGTILSEENNLISFNGQVSGINDVDDDSLIDTSVPYNLETDDSDNTIVININNIPII